MALTASNPTYSVIAYYVVCFFRFVNISLCVQPAIQPANQAREGGNWQGRTVS